MSPSRPEETVGGPERRRFARLLTDADVDVETLRGLHSVQLMDVARGGARLVSLEPLGKAGERFKLFLPNVDSVEVSSEGEIRRSAVNAEIIRSQEEGPQRFVLSVRFVEMDAALQPFLDAFIESLLKQQEGPAPRLSRRRDIRCHGPVEQTAQLQALSIEGAVLVLGAQLAAGTSLDLTFPDEGGADLLGVKARVESCRAVEGSQGRGHELRVLFSPMRPERQACLQALMRYFLLER